MSTKEKEDIIIKEDITIKEIYNELSKPLKNVVKIFLGAVGINAVGVISFVVAYTNHIFEDSNAIWNIIRGVLIVLFIIQFIVTVIMAVIVFLELIRMKWHSARIKECGALYDEIYQECARTCHDCKNNVLSCRQNIDEVSHSMQQSSQTLSQDVNALKRNIMQMTLAKYILDEERITELESSVGEGGRIAVMTTKFHLDTKKLVNIILDNIRKGVIYEYIIPDKNLGLGIDSEDFEKVYNLWWDRFKLDLFSKEFISSESNKFCGKYKHLRGKALSAKDEKEKKEAMEEAKNYFKQHVKEYDIEAKYSLVTIIMYQKGSIRNENLDIIIKLPTVTDDNYYAFQIPDKEYPEKVNLINGIRTLCKKDNSVELNIID